MMGKSYAAPVIVPASSGQKDTLSNGLGGEMTSNSISRGYGASGASLQMCLTDPLFQDVDSSCRRYLIHFADHLSRDLVVSDTVNENPFRGLIPLTGEMPILRHILVANAAVHIASINRRVCHVSQRQSQLQASIQGSLEQPRLSSINTDRAIVDALSAKHNAINLLRFALQNIQTINTDLVVTVVLLFVNFELLVSGKNEWRVHLQGALRLLGCLNLVQGDQSSPLALMRDRITSDCLTYYVLGSTLTHFDPLPDPPEFNAGILATLRRGEPNSYLSFPTTLLDILFRACELANKLFASLTKGTDQYSSLVEEALSLLASIDSFDINSWALSIDSIYTHRMVRRMHTASAHQDAVRIYICRSVGDLDLLGFDIERLVENIIHHLSFLDAEDPLFKATAWPTFIAGAETNNHAHRQWALERLDQLWSAMPWGYVQTANEVMRMAWGLREKSPSGAALQAGWIHQLKSLGNHWLIA
ncbi:uncharacterized protein KD926_000100 [Aspergillus affinis]|uniref:uncharacterized protein n=1 Tax=Aspergillus affinis TaxID=1070780 RepID=UPI0022FE70F0|nr:uncharacterized protein KD926_000100 [Aspergillus affinis]KAI9037684.1 hypothetical protein KD926_000100 [Aspergillus affinis]